MSNEAGRGVGRGWATNPGSPSPPAACPHATSVAVMSTVQGDPGVQILHVQLVKMLGRKTTCGCALECRGP